MEVQMLTRPSLSRSGPAIAVAAIHVAVLYGISVSLGVIEPPKLVKPSEVVFVPTAPEQVEQQEVRVSEPEIAQPDVTVPEPEVMPVIPLDPAPMMEAAPSQAAPQAMGGPMQELKATQRVEPAYPAVSRRLGEEGVVQLRVLVDAQGRPKQVAVDGTSGHARLDQAAIAAVKRWRFQPAMSGSGPVESWSRVNITFRLQ